jgi:hypothetical protein
LLSGCNRSFTDFFVRKFGNSAKLRFLANGIWFFRDEAKTSDGEEEIFLKE